MNWQTVKDIGTSLFWPTLMLLFFGIIFFSFKQDAKEKKAEEARRWKYVYSADRSDCNEYTHLVDFEFHRGIRNFATLKFENGEKFLYECGERAIDICNNLRVGTKVCYYRDSFTGHPMEVVQGWNDNLK